MSRVADLRTGTVTRESLPLTDGRRRAEVVVETQRPSSPNRYGRRQDHILRLPTTGVFWTTPSQGTKGVGSEESFQRRGTFGLDCCLYSRVTRDLPVSPKDPDRTESLYLRRDRIRTATERLGVTGVDPLPLLLAPTIVPTALLLLNYYDRHLPPTTDPVHG